MKNKLSDEQKVESIGQIRSFMQSSNLVDADPEFYLSNWYITRFLVARKYNIDKTTTMIRGYFDFRRRMEQLAEARPDLTRKSPRWGNTPSPSPLSKSVLNQARFEEIFRQTGQCFYHWSRHGHPVFVQRMCQVDPEFILSFKIEEIELYYYILHEKIMKVLFPCCSRLTGRPVDQIIAIYDLANVSLWSLFTKVGRGRRSS